MKKILLFCIFILFDVNLGMSNSNLKLTYIEETYVDQPYTYYNYVVNQAWNLFTPDEEVQYVIKQCFILGVDPINMLTILSIENRELNPNAKNINYKTEYNRKKKKYIKVIDSMDLGYFQLNNKHIEEFIYRFWTPYETEVFDVYNYKHNTRIAIRLFRSHMKNYNNNLYLSVCAYNGGAGNVARNTIPDRTVNLYMPLFYKNKYKLLQNRNEL